VSEKDLNFGQAPQKPVRQDIEARAEGAIGEVDSPLDPVYSDPKKI
jgi:hypothetical protein